MVSLTNFRSVNELCASNLSLDTQQDKNQNFKLVINSANGKSHSQKSEEFKSASTEKQLAAKNEHFEIRWNNLTYQVEPKWYQQRWQSLSNRGESNGGKQRKTRILDNLNGSVKSGQVTAILGPSGAGKTSLLGCLTGKNKSGVAGSVQILSNRREPMSICTIPQKGEHQSSIF